MELSSDALRPFLRARGTRPVNPEQPTRKRLHAFARNAYKRRNLIERAFCRLKDWRRAATRYGRHRLCIRQSVRLPWNGK